MTKPDDTLTPIPNRREPSAWPPVVFLHSHHGPQEYRLVHDLRSRRPARADLGNTPHMPVTEAIPARWGRAS